MLKTDTNIILRTLFTMSKLKHMHTHITEQRLQCPNTTHTNILETKVTLSQQHTHKHIRNKGYSVLNTTHTNT